MICTVENSKGTLVTPRITGCFAEALSVLRAFLYRTRGDSMFDGGLCHTMLTFSISSEGPRTAGMNFFLDEGSASIFWNAIDVDRDTYMAIAAVLLPVVEFEFQGKYTVYQAIDPLHEVSRHDALRLRQKWERA